MSRHQPVLVFAALLTALLVTACGFTPADPPAGREITDELREACSSMTESELSEFAYVAELLKDQGLTELEALWSCIETCPESVSSNECSGCCTALIQHAY